VALGVLGLLTAALVALWVRSYWVDDRWYVYDPPVGVERRLASARGIVGLYRVTWDPQSAPDGVTKSRTQREYSHRPGPMGWDGRVDVLRRDANCKSAGPILGAAFFVTGGQPSWPSYHHWEVMLPYWLMFALSAGAAAWAAWRPVREWRARRVRPGACRACGYDLRATPERCPECGAVPLRGRVAEPAAAP
jgi:hypothetical protein